MSVSLVSARERRRKNPRARCVVDEDDRPVGAELRRLEYVLVGCRARLREPDFSRARPGELGWRDRETTAIGLAAAGIEFDAVSAHCRSLSDEELQQGHFLIRVDQQHLFLPHEIALALGPQKVDR